MMNRRTALALTAGASFAPFLPVLGGRAQAQTLEQLQLFVPAAPGGGWDQTARTIEQVMRAEKLIGTAQITNVGGAGGAVGLPQFVNQWKGRPNAMMVAGMVMVGALIANKAAVKLSQTTPVARLTGEFLALVVPANSPFKTVGDMVTALKSDPGKVPVAGGSAGGSDHILLGMIGKAAGVEPSKLSYVTYSGGGAAQAAILGSQVAAGISGFGEFAEQVKAGKMRVIGISADKRQPGIDAPTLKEAGVDVEPQIPGIFRVGDTRHTVSSLERIRALGWEPTAGVEDNVRQYLGWFDEQAPPTASLEEAERVMVEQGVVRTVALT